MPGEAFDACRDLLHAASGSLVCQYYTIAKDWQSLIAGLFALIGACIAIFAVNRQIKANLELENMRIRRESVAARAVLPLSLAAIVEHGNRCIKSLHGMRSSDDPVARQRGASFLPHLADGFVEPIQNAIRFSDQEHSSRLSALALWLQVHQARLTSLHEFNWAAANLVISNDAIEMMMADSAQLVARAEDLFEYGRAAAIGANRFDVEKARWALTRNNVHAGMVAGDGDPHARVARASLMDNQTTDRIGIRRG